MKVSKFKQIADQNTWMWRYFPLKRNIYGFQQNPSGRNTRRLRDWLGHSVSFIAFRPFEKLDQMARNSENWEQPVGNSSVNGVLKKVEFEVLWHFRAETPWRAETAIEHEPFSSRFYYVHGEENPTLGQMLQRVITSHLENPYDISEIHLDAVVKRSYRFSVALRDNTNETFEIFLIPKLWVPEWMKTDQHIQMLLQKRQILIPGLFLPERMKVRPASRERSQASKYLAGEALGPIIPGMSLV